MQMLYNSDSFVVVQFNRTDPQPQAGEGSQSADAAPAGAASHASAPATADDLPLGYEIVDKTARKEIYIDGELAARFKQGVQALIEQGGPTEEAMDDFIAGFSGLAQQPVVLH